MAVTWLDAAADAIDPGGDGGWVPYPKQQIATELAEETDEVLFGGAAGPGKTEWGMEYVIDQMELYPGNRGGIFRRVFPSLEKSVIPRLKQKLKGRARWNGQVHTFTFPNESILELASLQYEDTVLDFQGAEYGIIFFEEITEFLQSQWECMLGRVRVPATAPVPLTPDGEIDRARMIRPHAIATTNPGGRGHVWVKRRFVRPKADDVDDLAAVAPMTPWRPKATDEDPEPLRRVFIPATHKDNPALLLKDPGYLNRLRQISNRGLRLAMEDGDWDAIEQIEGALWNAGDIDLGRLSPERFKIKIRTQLRCVAVDPSDGEEKGDEFGVTVASRGLDGVGYVEWNDGWKNVSVRTMARQAIDVYHEVGADALVVERNHGGKWMIEVFRTVDPYVNIVEVWASDGKRTRARPVSNLFEPDLENKSMPFKARLVGFHDELEEQMTTTRFVRGEVSPDRLDSMVWAMSWLMFGAGVAHSEGQYQDDRLAGRR